MVNINEHINNENWSEALALLKTGNVLDDIDFGYVFLLRVNYLQEKDVEKRKLVEDFINYCIELGFIPENVFQAASVSDHKLINQLVDNGHDINETEYRNLTGLHIAVLQQDKRLVEFLMTLNADNYFDDVENNKPIDYADIDSEIYQILKSSGVLSRKETEEMMDDYYTAVEVSNDLRSTQMEFMEGAENGDIVKMESALKRPKGFWVLHGSWPVNGKTALHLATEKNRIEATKYLIEKGLDKNKPDHKGETSFDIAKRLSLSEILNIMADNND
jgi:hypothetical protein